jgi:hypothetical protein
VRAIHVNQQILFVTILVVFILAGTETQWHRQAPYIANELAQVIPIFSKVGLTGQILLTGEHNLSVWRLSRAI